MVKHNGKTSHLTLPARTCIGIQNSWILEFVQALNSRWHGKFVHMQRLRLSLVVARFPERKAEADLVYQCIDASNVGFGEINYVCHPTPRCLLTPIRWPSHASRNSSQGGSSWHWHYNWRCDRSTCFAGFCLCSSLEGLGLGRDCV